MTPFEFVIIFLIGGVMILCIVGNDRSQTNAVCCILAIGLVHRSLAWLKSRSRRVSLILDSPPVVLMSNGEWHSEMMDKMRIHEMNVMAAARSSGMKSLRYVQVRGT